tara:strand:+ start:152 stop:1126 length:975 start_codon:yes stop_codon:yes gene_type:complete
MSYLFKENRPDVTVSVQDDDTREGAAVEYRHPAIFDEVHQEPVDLLPNMSVDVNGILKDGFVRLVDFMPRMRPTGTTLDYAIVQAARVSYGAGTKTHRDDVGLIRHLLRNKHTSPFEMVELKFHVKMPIFVARQWVRHRTASINEYSGRYSEMPDECYIPEEWRGQGKNNRQGSEGVVEYEPSQSYEDPSLPLHLIEQANAEGVAFQEYKTRLEAGVSRELARTCLPLSTFTEWYWKIDLHNLMHFLRLRLDSHAQEEIRVYGCAIDAIISKLFPSTHSAFRDFIVESMTLSRLEIDALKGVEVEFPTKGEAAAWEEKKKLLGI